MPARFAVALVFSIGSLSPLGFTAAAQQHDSLAPRPPAGAVFRGRVVHLGDASPVRGAEVWLVLSDKRAQTDSNGAFRFEGLPVGKQLVQIRLVGLAAERDTIVLSAEHENVRTYALAEPTASLDTVRTVAGATKYISPRLRGFEERRLSGQGGRFISDSVIRKNESTTMANLISSRMPGLMQQTIAAPGKGVITVLVSTRKQCSGLAIMNSCKGVPNCYVAIYLDGTPLYSTKMGGAPPDFAREFSATDFAGIEYYAGGAASPFGMNGADDGCGSLCLWTRER